MTYEQLMANITALRKAAQHEPDPEASTEIDYSNEPEARAAAEHDQKVREAFEAKRNARRTGDPTIKTSDKDDDMDETLSQHTPPGGSLGDNGRLATARAIRAAHKGMGADFVKSHFSARSGAPRDIDLDNLRLTRGDVLRKSSSTLAADLARVGIAIKPAAGLEDSLAVFKQMKATLSPTLPGQNSNSVWGDAPADRPGL